MLKNKLSLLACACAALSVSAGAFDQFGVKSPLPEEAVNTDPQAQVVAFQPNWLQPVLPETQMQPGEDKFKLQNFATPGEYEPYVFALRSDRTTKLNCEVTPFTNAAGNVIGAENYQLRVQRTLYTHNDTAGKKIISPLGLDIAKQVVLKANETVAFMLDVKVPQDAKPGMYKATIKFTGASKNIDLPVVLRVMPFKLIRNTRSYGSYFLGRYLTDPGRSGYAYSSEAMLEKICKAHHALGFNSAQFCEVTPRLKYVDGKVVAEFDEIEKIVKAWRAAGNNGLVSLDIRLPGWWCDELSVILEKRYTVEPTRYTVEQLENTYPYLNPIEHNLKARWSKDYRLSENAKKFYRQFLRQLFDLIKKNNWENIYVIVEEESGNGGLKLWGLEQFGPIAAEFPEAKIMFYDNSPHLGVDLGHKYREWIQIRQYNFISPELVATAKADGRELWYYNRGWNRAAFGFPVWKLGANGVHMWADQWFDVAPYGSGQPRYPVWSVFYPSPNGPLPTLEGIRAREGIDDLGYLDTLLDRISKLEAAGKKEATARARKQLEQLKNKLPLTNPEFNAYRQQMTVENAFAERWKLAAEIIRLDKELNNAK